ncbi:hypothetical protein MAR_008057 [Mya arenaria]|uniref:Uncharacterized protein n=1 Tax=Mya arenaria TaxID=6604 RepID=A0ABY7DX79_MYAAR|nr:hypothetical protein MAR_008057 [Mya arenaria]
MWGMDLGECGRELGGNGGGVYGLSAVGWERGCLGYVSGGEFSGGGALDELDGEGGLDDWYGGLTPPSDITVATAPGNTLLDSSRMLSIVAVVEEMGKSNRYKSDIDCSFYETSKDVPDPRELSTDNKNLMIFDDLLLEKQNKCESYYIRGRHSNVDCFYLSQNYFKLPRQTIRENANFICLFSQDLKNISHIYNDHVSSDMTKDHFNFGRTKAYQNGKEVTIRHNLKVEGDFLPMLAGLAATVAPILLKTVLSALGVGAMSGLASTGVS